MITNPIVLKQWMTHYSSLSMKKSSLLRQYYKELTELSRLKKENPSEYSQKYRDKLFQIKQLIRYGKIITYEYEHDEDSERSD